MATKPSLRLAHAVLLMLLFLLPTMWLVGAAEGVSGRPTFVFWLVLILPLFILPWLLSCCAPEETTDGHKIAARQLPHDSTIAERFQPDARRFALGALALVLLVLILLPVPAAVRLMNLDSPYQ